MHINGYHVRQHEIGVMERRTKYPRNSEVASLPAEMVRECFHHRGGGIRAGHRATSQISEGTDGGGGVASRQNGNKDRSSKAQGTVIQFGWTMMYCRGWWCLGGKGKLRLNYEGF